MNDLIQRLRGKYSIGDKGVYEDRDFGSFTPKITSEAADLIEKMTAEIERLTELNQKLYEFFKEGVDCAFTAADQYGADIQEKAVELGLMHKVEATEPCGENCMCEEIAGFPVDCYRPVSLQNNIGGE